MKKLAYLFFTGTLFVFAACNCDSNNTTTDSVEKVATCADDCQKACCLGCKATEGDVVCLTDHSCCTEHTEESACCCGDESCDGSCHTAAEATEESHEGHNHE